MLTFVNGSWENRIHFTIIVGLTLPVYKKELIFLKFPDADSEKPQSKKRRTEESVVSSTVDNGKKRKRDDENEVCFLSGCFRGIVSFSIHLVLCLFLLYFLQFWTTKQQNVAGKLLWCRDQFGFKCLKHHFLQLLLSLTLALLIMLYCLLIRQQFMYLVLNLMPDCRKWHFRGFEIPKFSGGASQNPLGEGALRLL